MRNAAVTGIRRIGALTLMLCAASAGAFPVTWTLSGTTFNDGGTASGAFVYDADTDTFSSWSVTVAGGDTATFPPLTYDAGTSISRYDTFNPTLVGAQFIVSASMRQLRLPGVVPLSDAGGTVALNLASGFQGECYNCAPYRPFSAGSLVGTAAPAITSAAAATFRAGQAGTFAVTATGAPLPTLAETGALPAGVTFVDNGNGSATLAGTPGPGTAGTYPVTITASNGIAPDATQNFVLTVSAPLVVTQAPMLGMYGTVALGLALLSAAMLALRRRRGLR